MQQNGNKKTEKCAFFNDAMVGVKPSKHDPHQTIRKNIGRDGLLIYS